MIDKDQYYTQRIARIAGNTPQAVNPGEVEQLYTAITSGDQSLMDQKYIGTERFSRLGAERVQTFLQYAEPLLGLPIEHASSYGTFAPTYQGLLKEGVSESGSEKPHRSLLIGATNSLAAYECERVLQSVFGDKAELLVIDVMGSKEFRDSMRNFMYASGSNIPLADGTLDSVQTNSLLDFHQLFGRRGSDHSFLRQSALKEAYRVLRPGGQLILVEPWDRYTNYGREYVQETVQDEIDTLGFSSFHLANATGFTQRSQVDDYFDDGLLAGNPNVVESTRYFALSAVK